MPSSGVRALVAQLMKLPKQERVERLIAMSQECIARQEDAAPFLELIQMELESPDDEPPASRPGSTSSTAAKPDPQVKARRRELTKKRNELRAMLAKVDNTIEPGSAASAGGQARSGVKQRVEVPEQIKARFRAEYDADPVAFTKQWSEQTPEIKARFRAEHDAQARSGVKQREEVPEQIKARFRAEYDADPAAFTKQWSEQTPEFRRQAAEMYQTKPRTPMAQEPLRPAPDKYVLLARAEARAVGGGKAPIKDARASQSSMGFLFGS